MATSGYDRRVDTGYHHGSLRSALLADGRRLLVEHGVDAVSLRELARRAGVSHAAPRRHFADRDALLAAIAAAGFDEMTDALRSAASGSGTDVAAELRAYAHTVVGFAAENGPLLSLMFSAKRGGDGVDGIAARRFFAIGGAMLGERPGAAVGPLTYLVAATFEGIGALVAADRLPATRVDEVVDAAVQVLAPRIEAARRTA